IHHRSHAREELANIATRQAGADGPQLAANLGGRIGLHVGEFELTGRAIKIKQNARACLAESRALSWDWRSLCRLQAQDVFQPDAEQAEPPGPEHIAAGEAVAQGFR